jgi:hypothetical protein
MSDHEAEVEAAGRREQQKCCGFCIPIIKTAFANQTISLSLKKTVFCNFTLGNQFFCLMKSSVLVHSWDYPLDDKKK